MKMKNKVLAVIERFNMLSKGDTVIVGVSGGADSVSLLDILCRIGTDERYNIVAVHLNHMLRGGEADRDEEYVRSFCRSMNVECICERADCKKIAKENSEGLEECGRRLRYEMFDRIASRYSGAKIATAHNADDNFETILLNITRGTSIKGVCGIPPVRGNIIRPLIECSRREIEEYCVENGLEYVTDSSNLSNDYSRNVIRNKVIPVLTAINPNAVYAASRLSRLTLDDEEYLENRCTQLYKRAQTGRYTFDSGILTKEPLPIRSRLYIKVYEEMTGERLSDSDKISETEKVLSAGGKVELHKNLFVRLKDGMLIFYKEDPADVFPVNQKEIELSGFEFCTEFCGYRVRSVKYSSDKINRLLTKDCLDCDTICGKLVLRGRKPGDKITLKKRNMTKTLKKLFSEEHIDEKSRNAVPVLADNCGVVWVMGFGVDKKNAADENSVNVIRLEGENI